MFSLVRCCAQILVYVLSLEHLNTKQQSNGSANKV